MKILLLVSGDVSAYYSAALMLRGHQIITHDRGISRSENPADWMPAITQYKECDACLLVSDDPQMRGIADWFGNSGKPVWHRLADVPGVKLRYSRLLYVLVPVFLVDRWGTGHQTTMVSRRSETRTCGGEPTYRFGSNSTSGR